MKQVYAPGCALLIYKPHLSKNILNFLNQNLNDIHYNLEKIYHALF